MFARDEEGAIADCLHNISRAKIDKDMHVTVILNGTKFGQRIDIQPSGNPSIVVSLIHLKPDPSLTVGSTVASTTSKIGTIVDFTGVERQALARYTQDAGNHVAVSVHPAASLSFP